MKNKFTIEEWFTLLEPEIRDKALANRKAFGGDPTPLFHRLDVALSGAFYWASTPEGHDFWQRLFDAAFNETRKPATNRGTIDCTIREGEER